MAELQPTIMSHGRHFVHHLGICNPFCVKLLQLMCTVIMHNSVKERNLYIKLNSTVSMAKSRTEMAISQASNANCKENAEYGENAEC